MHIAHTQQQHFCLLLAATDELQKIQKHELLSKNIFGDQDNEECIMLQ